MSWTIPAATSAGSFRVYLQSSGGVNTLLTTQTAVAGQTSYAYNWTVTQPVATGYKILVWYVNAGGTQLYNDVSDVAFHITAAAEQPTVTNPNAGGKFPRGSSLPVSWTVPGPVGSGQFLVYLQSSKGTYYLLTTQNVVAGQTSYSYSWTITQPVGTGYNIRVWYRNAAGTSLYNDISDVAFDITRRR